MVHFDRLALARGLKLHSLIDRIETIMRNRPTVAVRQRSRDADGRELLVMPALHGGYAAVKALTVVPANRGSARPVISGLLVLFDLASGVPLATMDADELTVWRTSAISATAARQLARENAATLTLLGAGHLAPYMAAAHAAIRPIRHIRLWARDGARARIAVERVRRLVAGTVPRIEAVHDLEAAVRLADIVCAATGATAPIIRGEWLSPGVHLDLVGGYRPDMREIDDEGIRRAMVFVDDREATLREAGDLMDPIRRGVITATHIRGDLADLCSGLSRSSPNEITLFKSVGTGIADLIAAVDVWELATPLQHSTTLTASPPSDVSL